MVKLCDIKPISEGMSFKNYLIEVFRDNGEMFSKLLCEDRLNIETAVTICFDLEDNLVPNIHSDCENYSESKDMCLKNFKTNISELKECQEKTTFNDNELQRKWSN